MKLKTGDLDKFIKEVKLGFDKSMRGINNNINSLVDPYFWDGDLFYYMFNVVSGFRSIIEYLLINEDKNIFEKAETIIHFQKMRLKDVENLKIDVLKYTTLNKLKEYYDSVVTFKLLIDGNLDSSLLDCASKAFLQMEKVLNKKDEYLKERTSAELIRRTLKKDYDYVISKFENSMKLSIKKPEEGEWKHAAKVCYLLSKIALGDKSESTISNASEYMTMLKFEWLGRHIIRDFGMLVDVESFFLLEYSYENIMGKYTGDVFNIFNAFKPETVVKELKSIAGIE